MSTKLASWRKEIRKMEACIRDQEVALFPANGTGERGFSLWRQIRPLMLRGASIEITPLALGRKWHPQELKRARDMLIQMRLIKRTGGGMYIISHTGLIGIDEMIREDFFILRLLEKVMVALVRMGQNPDLPNRRNVRQEKAPSNRKDDAHG